MSQRTPSASSRRTFLKRTAGSSAALALGGSGALSAFAPAKTFAQTNDLPAAINPIEAGARLRWVDSGDQKANFYRDFFARYAASRNVEIAYDPLPWNEIAKVVPLGVRNGTAPDVFVVPLSSNPSDAVKEGWIRPYDEFIPDIEAWKAGFPEGSFLPGINEFDGKTYGLPHTSNKRAIAHLLYDRKMLADAGYDPEDKPLAQSEFRDAAKKITDAGKGRTFGFILGGNQVGRWAAVVRDMGRLAGASAGADSVIEADIDFRTGEYTLDSDEYIEAVELLIAMRMDGSFFPGIMGINAPQAREFMPQGAAGMILQGPWNIPAWENSYPDFDFGVSSTPVPDEGPVGHLTIGQGAAPPNTMFMYADSPNGALVGDIFHYLGTLEGQIAWAEIVGAGDPPIFPEAIEKADLSVRSRAALELFSSQIKVGPNPIVRKGELASVIEAFAAPELSLAVTVQGLVGGQLEGVAAQMKKLRQRYDDALDAAFDKARAGGADVTRDDLVFANWDPASDFGAKDY